MWWNPAMIFSYIHSVDSIPTTCNTTTPNIFYDIGQSIPFLRTEKERIISKVPNVHAKSTKTLSNVNLDQKEFTNTIKYADNEYSIRINECFFNKITSLDSIIHVESFQNLSKVNLISSYFHECKSTNGCGGLYLIGSEFISKGNCFEHLSSINLTDTIKTTVTLENTFNFSSIVLCGESNGDAFGNSVIELINGQQIIVLANSTFNSIKEGYSGFQFYDPKMFHAESLTIVSNYKGSILSVRTSNTQMGLRYANVINNTATKKYPLIIFKQNLFQISNAVFIFNSGDHFASKEEFLEGGYLEVYSSSFDIRQPISQFIVFQDCVFSIKEKTHPFYHLKTGICQTIPQNTFGIGQIIAIIMSVVLVAFIIIVCFCCGKKKCPKFTWTQSDSQLP